MQQGTQLRYFRVGLGSGNGQPAGHEPHPPDVGPVVPAAFIGKFLFDKGCSGRNKGG